MPCPGCAPPATRTLPMLFPLPGILFFPHLGLVTSSLTFLAGSIHGGKFAFWGYLPASFCMPPLDCFYSPVSPKRPAYYLHRGNMEWLTQIWAREAPALSLFWLYPSPERDGPTWSSREPALLAPSLLWGPWRLLSKAVPQWTWCIHPYAHGVAKGHLSERSEDKMHLRGTWLSR